MACAIWVQEGGRSCLMRVAVSNWMRTAPATVPAMFTRPPVSGVPPTTTAVIADNFPTVRAFETGSWLGRRFQGRGIGTEMRIATLHLGFLALDASTATTAAFADNGPSTGVTRKLGYEPNGVGWLERRGQRAEINRFVMSRQHFLDHIHRDDVEIEGDAEVRDFLAIARTD